MRSEKVQLNNGVLMDRIGYGLYKVPPSDAEALCIQALDAGYRMLDTAALYANEAGVGQAVHRFTSEQAEASREDIFITTKVWNDQHGFDAALRAYDHSLKTLALDYVDLYLIHWPLPRLGKFIDTYRALERLYHEGRVRAIGVSNFKIHHLEQLLEATDVVPAVNQVELHPWLQQADLRDFHDRHGIRTEAWSPLGRGAVLADPVVRELAGQLGRTPAQVVLRWHLQLGNIVIPKASSNARIRENLDLAGFSLDEGAMQRLAGLERNGRIGSDPDEVN
ncbi:aldo/keto reductase [Arthrobacter sp. I2-34]|uniref:Aldo/keto reductase n=1 Tax=Arthrobacter hankyongi TaxID=2904801 RepID=A0ABS9L6E0_9MICC|nr:aldo/keto reductase [Arthrobacter hankyongi]MCG2622246.1 aldo/keto reductase [Arthrobacter hankyongi]